MDAGRINPWESAKLNSKFYHTLIAKINISLKVKGTAYSKGLMETCFLYQMYISKHFKNTNYTLVCSWTFTCMLFNAI